MELRLEKGMEELAWGSWVRPGSQGPSRSSGAGPPELKQFIEAVSKTLSPQHPPDNETTRPGCTLMCTWVDHVTTPPSWPDLQSLALVSSGERVSFVITPFPIWELSCFRPVVNDCIPTVLERPDAVVEV